ncbi:MAG: Phosphoribosylglycinamide formyltransferase [Candidatus Erwinia impunctatus]|nr:Phosphoribosylglycinamide formyltransferase [Culicoides impunctatus]
MKKIVVLVSGNGSNLQAIIDACEQGRMAASVVAVFSNKADAFALTRAREAGIPAHALSIDAFTDRDAFDCAMMREIDAYSPDVVVLAGYMRIITAPFVLHYAGMLLNIHPSLLPLYPGLHTHRKALENGDQIHGTTVHFVTTELDSGPVILQATVPVYPEDNVDDIAQRVQYQEHQIYPLVISWFIADRLKMQDSRAWLDNSPLPAAGYAAE